MRGPILREPTLRQPTLTLRPVTPADRGFLVALYAATRETELAHLAWDDATKAAFLAQQYDFRERGWRTEVPDARSDVIEVDGHAAGRLSVDRRPEEIRLIDIALLPHAQGRGFGTTLLRELATEADASARTLSLHVERSNRARHLYVRLGFAVVQDRGPYLLLVHRPEARTSTGAG